MAKISRIVAGYAASITYVGSRIWQNDIPNTACGLVRILCYSENIFLLMRLCFSIIIGRRSSMLSLEFLDIHAFDSVPLINKAEDWIYFPAKAKQQGKLR
ncbi:hypothetical protein GCM10009096_02580 [Parasphingorhabdus litoris]|uniref:Uncharacterized protein n=1 Tax=Parasphingorhabdus litoris TaxID=394733 RepID=A0ABN1A1S0_9SPHN|nr:hypothetical protein [Parasphingorhabdus litoris]